MEISEAKHKLEQIINIANQIGNYHIARLANELQSAIEDDDHITYDNNDGITIHYNSIIADYEHGHTLCNADDPSRSSIITKYCSKW